MTVSGCWAGPGEGDADTVESHAPELWSRSVPPCNNSCPAKVKPLTEEFPLALSGQRTKAPGSGSDKTRRNG